MQAVDLAGQRRGDRRLARIADARATSAAAPAVSACTIGFRPSSRDELPALRQRMDMAVHGLQPGEGRALDRQQVMIHPLEMLADDMQARIRQQMVDVGDAAGDGIVDRDHGELGALPSRTAAKASSKVAQGRLVIAGKAVRQARSE